MNGTHTGQGADGVGRPNRRLRPPAWPGTQAERDVSVGHSGSLGPARGDRLSRALVTTEQCPCAPTGSMPPRPGWDRRRLGGPACPQAFRGGGSCSDSKCPGGVGPTQSCRGAPGPLGCSDRVGCRPWEGSQSLSNREPHFYDMGVGAPAFEGWVTYCLWYVPSFFR